MINYLTVIAVKRGRSQNMCPLHTFLCEIYSGTLLFSLNLFIKTKTSKNLINAICMDIVLISVKKKWGGGGGPRRKLKGGLFKIVKSEKNILKGFNK